MAVNEIIGTDENDKLVGTDEKDNILGKAGDDTIIGGAGNDSITGGKGDDVITSGTGLNSVYFFKGDGDDVINLTKGEKINIFLYEEKGTTTKYIKESDIELKYSENKKDLIIYVNKNDHSQGSITLKNFATKDILNNATKTSSDDSRIQLLVGFDNNNAQLKYVDLKKNMFVTNEPNKNYTGSWLNDDIDASATTLYKDKKQTVEKEAKDRGLTLNGGDGKDKITGTKYSDVIYGGAGNDTIIGGQGNDTITGGTGDNTIKFVKGEGNDVVYLTKDEKLEILLYNSYDYEENTGIFVDYSDIKYKYSENKRDLIIYFDEDETQSSITIKDFAIKRIDSDVYLRYAQTSDPTLSTWINIREEQLFNVDITKNYTGTFVGENINASTFELKDKQGHLIEDSTKKGLTIDGKGGFDSITGSNYSDTIKGSGYLYGGKGNDTIYGASGVSNGIFGEDGDDVIYGGSNSYAEIFGGAGNDTITGGSGFTMLYFEKGNGEDVVNLTKGETLLISMFESLNLEDFDNSTYANKDNVEYQYSKNGKDLIIYYNKDNHDEGSITLKNYALRDVTDGVYLYFGKNPETHDPISVDLRKDIWILKDVDKNFTGTWLNDDINASGTTLYKDKKKTVEKEAKDRGLTLNGGAGDDKIIGTKYSDVINGGNGNDEITGGKGNDTITGGVGENTLYYAKGDGGDVINLTKGENFKLVLSDVTDIDNTAFELSENGKNLLIFANKDNREEYITIKNFGSKDVTNNATKKTSDTSSVFVKIGETEYDLRKDIVFKSTPEKNFTGSWLNDDIDASGTTLYKDKKKTVEKEAKDRGLTLNSGAGDDKITGTKYSDVIKGGNGDDVIDGGAGNDTITGGTGTNKIVYRHGDGNDIVNITKGEDLIIALPNVNNFSDIIFEIAPNGKDLIIRANNANRDEFMTIKDYVSKDVLNSGKFLLGESEREEYFSQIKINVNPTKNFTGTRLNEVIKAIEATKGVTINSGAGNDTVYGSDYNDVIKGTSGSKKFFGGKGNDTIYGTNDIDNTLEGGEGDDKIYAGSNHDTIKGGTGNDFIKGGDGDDSIWGDTSLASESDGNDTIYGEGGNDKIFGDGGDDYIDGGAGDDTIYGNGGNDTIIGGAGKNKIVYKTGDGDDTIILTKGEDLTIELQGPENWSYIKMCYAENGKDLLIYPSQNKEEHITIKDFITKDVTNSITLDINGDKYDLKTGKNLTNPSQRYLYVQNDVTKDTTGTWMADELNAYSYIIYDEEGNPISDPTKKGLTLDGGAGDDMIIASKYSDVLKGGDGNDDISAYQGGNDTIYGGAGNDNISCGDGNDLVDCDDGNDYVQASKGNDTIYGGEGDDYIKGGEGDDLIYGDDGDDSLYGEEGNDKIYGGDGDDYITGKDGNDSLYGDEGNDTIYADDGDDVIYGGAGNDRVTGDAGNDLIDGEDGNDNLSGNDGNDTIYGGEGNDTIYGDNGDDYIEGGAGNDSIRGGAGANKIVYNSGDGDDLITLTKGEQFKLELKDVNSIEDVEFAVAANRRDYIIYVDKHNHEAGSITLESFAVSDVTNNATSTSEDTSYVKLVINGTEYDLRTKNITVTDNYTGTWFNENIDATSATKGLNISAMGGKDTIIGSDYNDTILGGTGNDTIYGGAGNDSIEGDADDDLIFGEDGNDFLRGNNGNDTLYGGDDNDTLYGGGGDDYIEGGKGNDYIFAASGQNHIVYNQGDGDDLITLTTGEQFKLELKDVESIDNVAFDVAGNGKDFIIYVDKNNHSAGSITLQDFAQSDVTNNATETTEDTSYVKLVIGENEYDLKTYPTINKTVTEDYTGSRFDENIDASSATKGLNINSNGGNDTIKGSNFADTLNGGDGNDSIEGNEGNDTIYGGAGNDTIKGNAGNNYIYGDDGNDTIYGGTGNDSIEGGAGDDKLYGGSGSCTIHGNTGNDTIWGSSTNGTIYGDEGNDELQGGQGADIIYGGIGNDYINGNAGNDTLYGGAGDDTLDGGYGSDTLYGGEGNDTYKVYFEKNAINSVIEDESGTNDIVNFTEWPVGLETCRKDQLHLVFNVSKDFNKSTDTISWVNILDDTNFAAWKSNPTGDFDGVKIKDNAIETINSSDNYHVTSADIATLAESVAAWLTDKGYNDVNAALVSENTADIEALIAKFGECNWQTTGA